MQNLEADFAAIIADGLQLVERDRRKIVLQGLTLRGERAERAIWVCGPASFIILKARAIHLREKAKDAHDLHYVLSNEASGVVALAAGMRELLDDPDAAEAVGFLESDYREIDSLGPARAAYFLYGDPVGSNQAEIDDLRASAHAYVQRLLDEVG